MLERSPAGAYAMVWGCYLATGALVTLWERAYPLRARAPRGRMSRHLGALITVFLVIQVVAGFNASYQPVVGASLGGCPPISGIREWPGWLKFCLFLVVQDFIRYWLHHLLHDRRLWCAHRWHHSLTTFWWLAGVRASVVQHVVFSSPLLLFWAMGVPPSYLVGLACFEAAQNNFMHANGGGRWVRRLEWLLITPRAHAIHHSEDPAHAAKNLGSLFSVWDRLFGTYVDPDDVDPSALTFGPGEGSSSSLRRILGV